MSRTRIKISLLFIVFSMTFKEFLLSRRTCTGIDSTKYAYMELGLLFTSINLVHFII